MQSLRALEINCYILGENRSLFQLDVVENLKYGNLENLKKYFRNELAFSESPIFVFIH